MIVAEEERGRPGEASTRERGGKKKNGTSKKEKTKRKEAVRQKLLLVFSLRRGQTKPKSSREKNTAKRMETERKVAGHDTRNNGNAGGGEVSSKQR